MDLPFLSYFPSESHLIQDSYNLVVDALFGFRFKPPVKDTFASVIETLKKVEIPICSVDVPSGISHDRFWKISLLFFIDCLISSYVLLIFSCCFKGRFNFQFFLNDKYQQLLDIDFVRYNAVLKVKAHRLRSSRGILVNLSAYLTFELLKMHLYFFTVFCEVYGC